MSDPGDRFFLGGDVRGLSLRPYRDGDERQVRARADFAAALAQQGGLPAGRKWTLLDGAAVLGVGGLERQRTRNGRRTLAGWAYLADLTPRQWAFGALMARTVLAWAARAHAPVRFQAVAFDIPAADRLLAHIGFRRRRGPLYGMMGELA